MYFELIEDLKVPEKLFTQEEVKKHNKQNDLWIILNNNVYNITDFVPFHPAGRNVLLEYAGQDCTEVFRQFHSETIIYKYHEKYCIGKLEKPIQVLEYPILNFSKKSGNGIPYGDSNNQQGFKSLYYNESHQIVREQTRKFLKENVAPYVDKWDTEKQIPKEIIRKCGEIGSFALLVGKPWPKKYFPIDEIFGIKVEDVDYFHEIVVIEESMKYASNGFMWLNGSVSIAVPPILQHASDFLKEKYIPPILKGEQISALAITEPWAGSDVAGIQTTAKLTECGKFYIVNGMKKFITMGAYADVFTTGVRTDEDKYFGVSLLIIERNFPGVKTRKMNMQGAWGSGTGFVIFENVKVPVENLIGDEGMAFLYIMKNFNQERFKVIAQCQGASRLILEECMKYAHTRQTFGKKLIEQPVIRQKLAMMIREVEGVQAWLEQIAFNLNKMNEKQEKALASSIAICKAHSTLVLEKIANESIQIFGGNGYQRNSVGAKIERHYRDCKSMVMGGGSPEIMFDMSIKMISASMPKYNL